MTTPLTSGPRGLSYYVAGVQAVQGRRSKDSPRPNSSRPPSSIPNCRWSAPMLGDIYRSQNRLRARIGAIRSSRQPGSTRLRRSLPPRRHLPVPPAHQEAVASYHQCVQIDPENVKSNMNLGLCYLTLNQRNDAIKYLRRATQLQPTLPTPGPTSALRSTPHGDLARRRKAYKRALELDKDQNVALLNLGANLIHQNKGEAAVSVMEEAVKRVDDAPTHTRYGQALTLAKKLRRGAVAIAHRAQARSAILPRPQRAGFHLHRDVRKCLELDDKLRLQAIDSWQRASRCIPINLPSPPSFNNGAATAVRRTKSAPAPLAVCSRTATSANAGFAIASSSTILTSSPSTNPQGSRRSPAAPRRTAFLKQLAFATQHPLHRNPDPRLRVVHRLDKETSGVLLFAKHLDAQRHLSHQFQNNTIEKEYLALVAGRPVTDDGEIDERLAPHPTSKTRMAVSKHGRPAERSGGSRNAFATYTLLRVFPKTGKTHQIRVHLAHIGLPLAGRSALQLLLRGASRPAFCSAPSSAAIAIPALTPERPLIERLNPPRRKTALYSSQWKSSRIDRPTPQRPIAPPSTCLQNTGKLRDAGLRYPRMPRSSHPRNSSPTPQTSASPRPAPRP